MRRIRQPFELCNTWSSKACASRPIFTSRCHSGDFISAPSIDAILITRKKLAAPHCWPSRFHSLGLNVSFISSLLFGKLQFSSLPRWLCAGIIDYYKVIANKLLLLLFVAEQKPYNAEWLIECKRKWCSRNQHHSKQFQSTCEPKLIDGIWLCDFYFRLHRQIERQERIFADCVVLACNSRMFNCFDSQAIRFWLLCA